MASTTRKRKAQDGLEEATKRLRLDKAASTSIPSPIDYNDEEDEDVYQSEGDHDSEDEEAADTPITPFSPSRKKFPSELKTIKCPHEGCTKTFNRPSRLTNHLRTHTNERPYVCKYEGCDKSYFEDKHLQQHTKGSHTHERSFPCDWEGCGKSFLTSTRLNRHKDTHLGHERFRCTEYPPCNQTFRKHQTLQRHIRSDHLHLTPFPCTFVDPVTGEQCKAGFDGGTGLRQHVNRVHGPAKFLCTECAAPGFKTERQLQAHVRKEHASCMFCDLKFSSQQVLVKHIESQHSGSTLAERKNVPCPYEGCGKRFTKQNNLNTHIRSAHMGERFICGSSDVTTYPDISSFDDSDACGKDYFSKASLVDHIRIAHFGLPSIVNANRKQNIKFEDDLIDDAEEDGEYAQPKKSKKKTKQAKASAVDQLLGMSYAADSRRTIPCFAPGCPHMFIREYDRQVHMQTAHPFEAPEADPTVSAFHTAFDFPLPGSNMGGIGPSAGFDSTNMQSGMFDQADIDWELQRQALEGGPFWVGADEAGGNSQDQDEWTQDQLEMRRLIG
ncbi:uncharacterized protein LY89DRAFT_419074 [Mollisia scopiformis]|uniref:C2H2-type domain-containing protein n=1 Tax=Mollisia scopiformis TaxID=149040 RepID=A0A194XL04_MOLSC|nr:uncharacterized protein LY89DRAFT_419074 [Mollisia scopiformis]KUJ20915.1 hypothetical protein LY89DRAFT_419074 [Mollisia scopiformis]